MRTSPVSSAQLCTFRKKEFDDWKFAGIFKAIDGEVASCVFAVWIAIFPA